jgi:hypothetical protein
VASVTDLNTCCTTIIPWDIDSDMKGPRVETTPL